MRSVGRGSLWDDLVLLLSFESHIQMIEQKTELEKFWIGFRQLDIQIEKHWFAIY